MPHSAPPPRPIATAGAADAPTLLLCYPWTPGNAAYVAAVGGPSEQRSRRDAAALLRGLARTWRVVAFEYPPGIADGDPPDALPIDRVVDDVLAVADAARADTFEFLGYSWSGSVATEVAARTSRCTRVLIGGWPPIDPPTSALAQSCRARAGRGHQPHPKTGPFLRMYASYYDSVSDRPPRNATGKHLLFYGDRDRQPMAPGAPSVADAVETAHDRLVDGGWRIHRLPGRDHATAMQATAVLAAVRDAERPVRT